MHGKSLGRRDLGGARIQTEITSDRGGQAKNARGLKDAHSELGCSIGANVSSGKAIVMYTKY